MTIDRDALLAAAALVDDLDGQRQREHDAFTLGFRLGYGHGHDIGYGRAHAELDTEWAAFTRNLRREREYAPHAELARRRYPPHGDARRWVRDGDYPPDRTAYQGREASAGDAA